MKPKFLWHPKAFSLSWTIKWGKWGDRKLKEREGKEEGSGKCNRRHEKKKKLACWTLEILNCSSNAGFCIYLTYSGHPTPSLKNQPLIFHSCCCLISALPNHHLRAAISSPLNSFKFLKSPLIKAPTVSHAGPWNSLAIGLSTTAGPFTPKYIWPMGISSKVKADHNPVPSQDCQAQNEPDLPTFWCHWEYCVGSRILSVLFLQLWSHLCMCISLMEMSSRLCSAITSPCKFS